MSEISLREVPEIRPEVAQLSDFSDRLSPMVVKELRQSMRTKAFTMLFLFLQVILGFGLLAGVVGTGSDVGGMFSRMVFFVFGIVALILQPLRGAGAVWGEMKDGTLEIMSLTRLRSVRIVFGKWASLVSQTGLMLLATLPYLVMRYFLGGMQLFAELMMMAMVFLLSGALTAVTVGFSANRSVIVRWLAPVLLVPFGLMFLSGAIWSGFDEMVEFFSFQDDAVNVVLGALTLGALFFGYYIFEMGVSQIAPLSENHTIRKRLVTLGFMLGIGLLLGFSDEAKMGTTIVLLVLSALFAMDIVSEVPVCLPRVAEPYVKRGVLGKLFGRFFYPGWHSGFLLLSVLVFVVFVVGGLTWPKRFLSSGETGLNDELVIAITGVFHAVFVGILIARLFVKRFPNPLVIFVGVQVLGVVLTIFLGLMTGGDGLGLGAVMSWIPWMWLFLMDDGDAGGALLMSFFAVISWLGCLVLVMREFGRTGDLEKRVMSMRKEGV